MFRRKLAERNFALARSAVHDYFITVSEDTLLQQPGMQGLREDLLRQALVYYQSFLNERQDDPSLRQEVADAHFYAGTIVQTINSPSEALPHFEKAADLQRELLEASPDDSAIKSDYGQSLNAIGGVYFRTGKIDEARDYFQQAAQVREQVTSANPRDLEAARVFANSVMNVGSTYLARQDYEQAIPLLDRAQMIRMVRVDELAKSDPEAAARPGDGTLPVGHRQTRVGRRDRGGIQFSDGGGGL